MHFTFIASSFALLAAVVAVDFHPRDYPKSIASCSGINRALNESVPFDIHYVDINSKASKTLLLVHGWPSVWSTWSKQILEFKDEYRLIVPNLRGFGESGHPGDVESSGNMGDMVADLICIIQHAQVAAADAVCIGHDWGSQICYEANRMRPDIFAGSVNLVLPYIPANGPYQPVADLVPHLPSLSYNLFFQEKLDIAVAELEQDFKRTMRATLRTVETPPPADFLKSVDTFLGAYDSITDIPPVPFFTSDEEDYFVEQFKVGGFKHTLQFYTKGNRFGSWQLGHTQGNFTVTNPVLSILPRKDPVANWEHVAVLLGSKKYLPNFTQKILDGAHWVHLENPQETNKAIREWLKLHHPSGNPAVIRDEL